jgi:rhodanese-related sulfurtransferase
LPGGSPPIDPLILFAIKSGLVNSRLYKERTTPYLPYIRLKELVEIAVLLLISAATGLLWNHDLLSKAWRGEVARPAAAKEQALPMPIGLPQVREFFDSRQAVFVDARQRKSFAEGHLAGAVNFPLEEVRQKGTVLVSSRIRPDAMVIAYCNGFSCRDSFELGKILIAGGYANVFVYEGGFPEWRDARYPVEKGGR